MGWVSSPGIGVLRMVWSPRRQVELHILFGDEQEDEEGQRQHHVEERPAKRESSVESSFCDERNRFR